MHADLDLDLGPGLGSHAGQDTRDGSKSLLVSVDGGQSQYTRRAIQSSVVCASEFIVL
jgi:hypothetical protein